MTRGDRLRFGLYALIATALLVGLIQVVVVEWPLHPMQVVGVAIVWWIVAVANSNDPWRASAVPGGLLVIALLMS